MSRLVSWQLEVLSALLDRRGCLDRRRQSQGQPQMRLEFLYLGVAVVVEVVLLLAVVVVVLLQGRQLICFRGGLVYEKELRTLHTRSR